MQKKQRIVSIFVFLILLGSSVSTAGNIEKFSTTSASAVEKPAESRVETYQYPRISPRAEEFSFKANGEDVFVYQTTAGPFAAFSCEGPIEIEVELPEGIGNISVSPKRHGIKPKIEGNKVSFQIPGPMLFAIMVDGMPELYVYANPLENNRPDPENANVKYFKAGQVYEVGHLQLEDNETLYVEGGAIIRGSVFAKSAENVKISGFGVLDGSYYGGGHYSEKGSDRKKSIVLEECKNSRVENIIMIEPTAWMIMLDRSEHITVDHVKQLGFVSTSDGVDIVGSRHIKVTNSFMRNGDDCVAIKSFDTSGKYAQSFDTSDEGNKISDFRADVEDVEVEGCVLIVFLGGSIFEIGHELRTETVKNIRYRNCDVLGAHDHCNVFGIHNTDRAKIKDVLYEDIRVEHYFNKLIDMRIIKSRYHLDEERGQVRDVVFRDIEVTVSKYNPGYSVSLIGGYDADHTVENVLFDDFRLNGEKVTNADQLDLFIKRASGIKFK